jgi:hypothetical protein
MSGDRDSPVAQLFGQAGMSEDQRFRLPAPWFGDPGRRVDLSWQGRRINIDMKANGIEVSRW